MARSFNGSSDTINTANIATVTGSGPWSIAIWCEPAVNSGVVQFAINDGNSSTGMGILPSYSGNSDFLTGILNGSAFLNGTTQLTLNTWAHLAITCTAGGISQLYLNGVANGSTGGGANNLTGIVSIGSNGLGTHFFQGCLADAAVWNTNLSGGQIATLAAGARANTILPGNLVGYWPLGGTASPEPDLSGNNNNGVLTGTSFCTDPPQLPPLPGSPVLFAQACL